MLFVGKVLITIGVATLILGFGTFQYHHFVQQGTVSNSQMLRVGRILLAGIIAGGLGLFITIGG